MPGDKALYAVLVAARRTTVCRKRRSSYHRFGHLRRHCRLTLHQTQLTTFALEQEVHRQTVCVRALPSARYRRRNCCNWKLGATALHNDNRSGWQASDEVTPAAFLWMTAWPTSGGCGRKKAVRLDQPGVVPDNPQRTEITGCETLTEFRARSLCAFALRSPCGDAAYADGKNLGPPLIQTNLAFVQNFEAGVQPSVVAPLHHTGAHFPARGRGRKDCSLLAPGTARSSVMAAGCHQSIRPA